MNVRLRASTSYLCNQEPSELGAIHTLPCPVLGAPVIFAFTPQGPGAKRHLAMRLLQALGGLDHRWRISPQKNKIGLHHSTLGRPYLLLGEKKGPSLSFSHGRGRLWGAMSSTGSVGIDVAFPEEFVAGYPFARAFRSEEMDIAKAICRNHTPRGAALIWSAKEASVKATGAGFNLFDPLQVKVAAPLCREQGVLFKVSAGGPIRTWARKEGRGWVSVALARHVFFEISPKIKFMVSRDCYPLSPSKASKTFSTFPFY